MHAGGGSGAHASAEAAGAARLLGADRCAAQQPYAAEATPASAQPGVHTWVPRPSPRFQPHTAERLSRACAPTRKLRYYKRYIQPGGLPRLHLYGVYAATANDGDKELYSALLRRCEGVGVTDRGSGSSGSSEGASGSGDLSVDSEGDSRAAQHAADPAARGRGDWLQQEVQAAMATAEQRVARLPAERRAELLLRADAQLAVEELLGMRMFLGGVSHGEFHAWARRTGFSFGGGANGSAGSQIKVEL